MDVSAHLEVPGVSGTAFPGFSVTVVAVTGLPSPLILARREVSGNPFGQGGGPAPVGVVGGDGAGVAEGDDAGVWIFSGKAS